MNKKTYNATDLYIAKKLRERRIELKLKQIELAKALDIASQQIFKYEKGSKYEIQFDDHPLYPPLATITVF